MVEVELYRRQVDKSLVGFTASGHAGLAPRGEDVVCAAVSALTTVMVLGLEARLGLQPEIEVNEDLGVLSCRLDPAGVDSELWRRSQDLLETLSLGLLEIEKDYPKHLKVEEVAV